MSIPDLAQQLERLRPSLLAFARLQLRNDAWAEDVVADTVLAILEKPDAFGGRSAFKTWAIGILKHKIIDRLRSGQREVQLVPADGENEADALEALFDRSGHVVDPPPAWGDPDACLEQRQFFDVLQLCVDKLPPALGRVFMMREWLELETEAICKELGITPSNCWVMLYRARMRLRECLQLNWFDLPGPRAGEEAA